MGQGRGRARAGAGAGAGAGQGRGRGSKGGRAGPQTGGQARVAGVRKNAKKTPKSPLLPNAPLGGGCWGVPFWGGAKC